MSEEARRALYAGDRKLAARILTREGRHDEAHRTRFPRFRLHRIDFIRHYSQRTGIYCTLKGEGARLRQAPPTDWDAFLNGGLYLENSVRELRAQGIDEEEIKNWLEMTWSNLVDYVSGR